MKPRKPSETDAEYIRRLEDQNAELKRQNAGVKKWGNALNEAVTVLSCEASVAFQAMAEKAGVRSHPSVTDTVELFDTISHPQWQGEKVIPKLKYPQFWDLDSGHAWSGDADMSLNAPVAELIELVKSYSFFSKAKEPIFVAIREAVGKVEAALQRGIEGVKDRNGFKPKRVTIPSGFLKDKSADELREIVSAFGWMALDLAQDMSFANEMLRRDLRAATYRRISADLYRLAWFDNGGNEEDKAFNIKIVGGEQDPF